MFLIGLAGAVLGFLLLFLYEPWLLDQAANEAVIQMTFEELLSAEINQNISSYLTALYRFFGLLYIGLGMLICLYVLVTFMGTSRARKGLLIVLGIFFAATFFLEYSLIPTSPLINLTDGLVALYLLSFWATIRLSREEKDL